MHLVKPSNDKVKDKWSRWLKESCFWTKEVCAYCYKKNKEAQEACECLNQSEIYAVYSPNRCYPEYIINYDWI